MNHYSHITNNNTTPFVRTFRKDSICALGHNIAMTRRGIPKSQINWYLPEWMASCGLEGRGAQAKMMKLTGWSRATMSQLYTGKQDYSPAVINAAAKALNAEPFELLVPPSKAHAMRRAMASAQEIVELAHESDGPEKDGTNN